MLPRLAVLTLLALLAAAAPASAEEFNEGVAAGEIRTTSAILWTRAPAAGPVTVEWFARDRKRRQTEAIARPENDLTVQVRVTGLRPGTRYRYRFIQGGAASSAIGSFETAPRPTSRRKVRFAYSGDADAQPATPGGPPAYNRFEVYDRMAGAGNDFNINIGDTIYSDSEVGGAPPALTLEQKWSKYKQNLALAPLKRLRARAGLFSHWDDHEFINDYSPQEKYGEGLYPIGAKAFTDYTPVRYTPADGLYRSVRWGRNLELFFLDERSFRSAKVSSTSVCDNPRTPGRPDLAPTAPQAVRSTFALIAPPLAEPVAPACLAAINDPSRTLLGTRQRDQFLRAVRRSKATFKVVMNEVPMMQLYALPYDRWEGYAAERQQVVTALSKVKNVVVLTTDTHANLIGDVRLRTLEPGGVKSAGFPEAITGPVATKTYAREIDEVLGRPGTADAINELFFRPQPPAGLGLRCTAADVYSYGQVEVTQRRLTVRMRDLRGRAIKNCPPLVVRRRR